MREVAIEDNPEAVDFAHRLITAQIDVVILLTGVGTRLLVEAIERHVDVPEMQPVHTEIVLFPGVRVEGTLRHRSGEPVSGLPIVLAGGGGGTLNPGRHVDLGRDVPMTNLYLSMLDRMGVELDRFGDSTGRVTDL